MKRKILILLALSSIFSSLFFSCASKVSRTELDLLFDHDFTGLIVPGTADIKAKGEQKNFPYTTINQVWDSAILVLMQEGILVRCLEDSNVIVTIETPPFAIFMEDSAGVNIYIYCMDDLYKRKDKPEKVEAVYNSSSKQKLATTFFEKLATQLYSGEKWKYLQGQE